MDLLVLLLLLLLLVKGDPGGVVTVVVVVVVLLLGLRRCNWNFLASKWAMRLETGDADAVVVFGEVALSNCAILDRMAVFCAAVSVAIFAPLAVEGEGEG
jgi:hypothetical protein